MSLAPFDAALLFAAAIAAGFANVVAGGGSLLTMPLLVLIGLPEAVANGSVRVAILVQNLAAVGRYHRRGRLDWTAARRLAAPTVLGGIGGAWLANQIDDASFRTILAWVVVAAALVVALPFQRWLGRAQAKGVAQPSLVLVWPVMITVGCFGGFVQAGVGYVLLAALTLVMGIGLVDANILKVVLVLAYTPFAIALFAGHGHIDAVATGVLAAGQAIGAWIGAGVVIQRGARLIRAVLVVAAVASALALLGVFRR